MDWFGNEIRQEIRATWEIQGENNSGFSTEFDLKSGEDLIVQ